MNRNNKNNNFLKEELRDIDRNDLDQIMMHSNDPKMNTLGKETVLYDKDSLMNRINSALGKHRENPEVVEQKAESLINRYNSWRHSKEGENLILADIWANWKKNQLFTKIESEEKKELKNSDISDIHQLIHTNKPTILSKVNDPQLTPNKPFGNAGDITINELYNKGLEVFDTPLVQMIKENVNIGLLGYSISSMIMYKSIVNLYMKNAYSSTLPDVLRTTPSTRSKEVALFMIMGAPVIAGAMLVINKVTSGGTKVIINIADRNNLEGTGTSSASSSSSLFLFFNKLPGWIKIILRYLAFTIIFTFITSVIGYKSSIITEIYSQFYIYLGYFLKLYCILNFLVIIYFIWKYYVIIMFAKNKEFINPDLYPKFIKNELLESKDIADNLYSVDPGKVHKHYLKLIFLYISIVIFGLTMMILNSIY